MRELSILLICILSGFCYGATYYADITAGNDGVASAAGYAYTASSKTLTKEGAFAGYTYHAGDQLQVTVTGASSKVDVGFYTIASRTSADAITLSTDASATNEDDTNVTLTVGNNGTTAATAAGTLNGPKKTISGALALIAADGTIQCADGTYTEATYLNINKNYNITLQGNAADRTAVLLEGTSGQAYVARVYTTPAGKTITFKNMSLTNVNDTTQNVIVCNTVAGGADPHLVLNNCYIYTFDRSGGTVGNYGVYGETSTAATLRNVTVTNCKFSNETNSYGLNLDKGQQATITGSTFDSGYGILLTQGVVKTVIDDCDFSGTSKGVQTGSSTSFCGHILIKNSDFTSESDGIYIRYSTNFVEIDNCTFTPAADALLPCAVGSDAATYTAGREVNKAVIRNCTINAADYNCHGYLLGSGVLDGYIYNCAFTGTSTAIADTLAIGYISKCEGFTMYNCWGKGVRLLYLKGSGRNTIINNTFKTTALYAFDIVSDTDNPYYNVIMYNIFDGSGGKAAVMFTNSFPGYNLMDYNIYYGGSDGLYYNGSGYYTFAELKAYWADAANNTSFDYTGNDIHSLNVNPGLYDKSDGTMGIGNNAVVSLGAGASLEYKLPAKHIIGSN